MYLFLHARQLLCRLFRPLLLESYNIEALIESARALGNLSRHADARQCSCSVDVNATNSEQRTVRRFVPEELVVLLEHHPMSPTKKSINI